MGRPQRTRKSASLLNLVIVILLTLAGFALRTHDLDKWSFRGDEAFTVIHWVRAPLLPTLASDIVTKDPQPPLAYALFHGWGRIFGDTEFALHLLPALISTLSIPAMFAVGRRIGGQRMGLIAALLWALHPFQIWHAQDARNYAIWATLSLIALWLALRALTQCRRIDWALYVIAGAAAAYVYYLELFTLVVLNLFVLIDVVGRRRDWRLYTRWIGSQIAIGLILAPWFLQARLLTGSGYGGTRGGGVDPMQILTRFLPSLNFGMTVSDEFLALVWPILLILCIASLYLLRRNRYALLLGLLGTIPLLLLMLVSLKLDVYVPRYVLGAAPAYGLLVAGLATTLMQQPVRGQGMTSLQFRPQSMLGIIVLIGWLGAAGYSLNNYFNEPAYAKVADWRTMSEYLHERVQPDDRVIQAAADEALTIYYADVDRLPANPNQAADEITATLEERRDSSRSLWLIGRTFPDWPNKDLVPTWFAENMQLVRATTAGALPVWQYFPWKITSAERENWPAEPLANFGNVAELAGIDLQTPDPSGEMSVWGYWQAVGKSDQPLKVFVHLVGAVNPATATPLWAQDDQFIQENRVSTDNWTPDEIYRDVYTLDVRGVPPGEYTIVVGMYDAQSGERVSVGDSDSFVAGVVTLP